MPPLSTTYQRLPAHGFGVLLSLGRRDEGIERFLRLKRRPFFQPGSRVMTLPGKQYAEVQRIVKGASPVLNGDAMAGGATEKLRVNDVKIAGELFKVSMYFHGDALAQVNLHLARDLEAQSALFLFDRVANIAAIREGRRQGRSFIGRQAWIGSILSFIPAARASFRTVS